MKTTVELGSYKGSKTISIFRVPEEDEPKDKYPIISFGINKAKAILSQIDEIKKFVESNDDK